MSTTVTGGIAMARQLAAEEIRHIFGIPGVQLDYAMNGLSMVTDQIDFIAVRHEQSATYAADGYARTTGDIGVALVVPGPGVLNAGAGLVTALATNSRVLLIAGQIPSNGIGAELGLLHEIPDQSGILATLCRSNELVTDPAKVAGALHGAIVQLGNGPGPVSVELPPDILMGESSDAVIGHESPAAPTAGDTASLDHAIEALQAAERPLIFAGGGARSADAWDEMHALAEALGAPLTGNTNGKGAYNNDHRLATMPFESKELLMRADCVLVLGSRTVDTRSNMLRMNPDATTISVNIDEAAFSPPRDFDVTHVGDAGAVAGALAAAIGGEREPWCTDLDDVRARTAEALAPLQPQVSYAEALRAAMPDDSVLINELTQVGYAARFTYPVRARKAYCDPGYQGTLGYGYPTAIGAAVGNPHRPVVSVNGDGGFGYGLAEMATVVHYNIPLIGVVFRDDAYGNVQRMHKQQFDGVHHGTDLTNPDMVKLAEAFGMPGHRAESPAEFETVLGDAIAAGGPCLIDVPMPICPDPWAIMMRPWRPE